GELRLCVALPEGALVDDLVPLKDCDGDARTVPGFDGALDVGIEGGVVHSGDVAWKGPSGLLDHCSVNAMGAIRWLPMSIRFFSIPASSMKSWSAPRLATSRSVIFKLKS